MTGANRVLVGIGWPLVVVVASIAVWRSRRAGGTDSPSTHARGVDLEPAFSAEVVFLGIATLCAVSLLVNLGLTVYGAAALFVLFSAQFVASVTLSASANRTVIIVLSVVYGVLAIGLLLRRRHAVRRIVRDGLITPFDDLVGSDR